MNGPGTRHPAAGVLPPGCKAYRSTPVFTENTIPPGLLRSHRTAPGTWALIHVLEGRLLYRVLAPHSERTLDPSSAPGLVEPGVSHEVVPLESVRFQVEFHKIPETASETAMDNEAGRKADAQDSQEAGAPLPVGCQHG